MIGMSGNHPCPPAIFHVAIENLQFPPFTDDLPIETSLYLLGQRVFMIANGRWFHQIVTERWHHPSHFVGDFCSSVHQGR
jgi:hypothetical protein